MNTEYTFTVRFTPIMADGTERPVVVVHIDDDETQAAADLVDEAHDRAWDRAVKAWGPGLEELRMV